jgi:phosphoribosylaminoimidazole-succinocarboxamide synthase
MSHDPKHASVYLGRERAVGGLTLLSSGKVRDIYALDAEHLLFVTTDRVSAFDVVMRQGIPSKGRVLTAVAAHWFEATRAILPNHLVSTSVDDLPKLSRAEKERLRGRVMIVRKAEPTPVEWVVRGYLAGSGWKEYQRTGRLWDADVPAGLAEYARLPRPLLTPTTKDHDHDLPLTRAEAAERVGQESFELAERAALALFEHGTQALAELGILLADTKFEFGRLKGRLILIDEALTPDSSRLWPAESWRPGSAPPSYDKQILRDWLERSGWDKRGPPPDLPDDLTARVAARYLEFCEKLTGVVPAGPAGVVA